MQKLQKFLDPPEFSSVHIAVDYREDQFFDEALRSMGADVDRRALVVGDFLCSARLAVERKTRSDFEQSVIDGRLFNQLSNLIMNYDRTVVVVEGVSDDKRLSRASLLGAYSAIIADFGVSLIFTRDKQATAEIIFHLAKHEQLAKKQAMRIYARKKAFTPSQTVRGVAESLPMVGPKLAKALMNHFGTLKKLAEASERDIAEVPGVGKKRAKLIKSILTYHYNEEDDKLIY